MPKLVSSGAALACSFGTSPSTLTILPAKRVGVGSVPVAVVEDATPMVNVAPFGMCTTVSNPQVATATSAALGVLTPQPCLPVPVPPWTPGSRSVKIRGTHVLTDSSSCKCQWGGVISITDPGQASVGST